MNAVVAPEKRRRERKAALALLVVTFIWGMTFVWMKQAVDADSAALGVDLGSLSIALFIALRFGIAALFMLLFVPSSRRGLDRRAWRGGLVLGGLLYVGFLLQMFGLEGVSPAVSAFLTSLYVVFTALINSVLEKKGASIGLVVGAALATFGGAFIGGPPQLSFGLGEWLTVACAFVFAIHILATDRITKEVAPMPVTLTSFATVTIGAIAVLAFAYFRQDAVEFDGLVKLMEHRDFWIPTLGSSLLATVVAISFMNVFQRELDPVRAAILYALEPVWAACISIGLGRDTMTKWLWIGGGALLAGNLIAELAPALAKWRAQRAMS